MPRESPRQGPPEHVDTSFPSFSAGPATWYRAHRVRADCLDGGCWFFASAPRIGDGGRFDLAVPHGTCYWADSEIAAARERLGRPGDLVAHDEVAGIVVSTAEVRPGYLADLLAGDAARRGVCQELTTAAPYAISQQWAEAFHSCEFDGIRYRPRFSTEPAQAIALFGAAGAGTRGDAVVSHRPVAEVFRECGYTVLDVPRADQLSILPE